MKKIINLIIVLFPILSGYGLSLSLDFGSIILFVCGGWCFIAHPRHLRFPIGYALFFWVALILSLVWARSIPLRLLLFSINLLFACLYADWQLLWKYYGKVVWICSAFLIIQELFYYAIGSRPSGILPFIPTIYGGDIDSRIAMTAIADRSASLFLEPSYFAQFLIPFVIINLFSPQKSELKKAVAASLIVVLSRSGVGIISLSLVWLFWFLLGNTKTGWKILVSFSALGLISLLLYAGSGFFDYFAVRSGELRSYSGDEQFQSSGFIRIFRGYFAFSDMPNLNKLFGSNPDDVQLLLDRSIFFGTESTNFINGMQTILFYHGIVGAILYIRHIMLFPYKTKNKMLIVMSVTIILLLLTESFYLSSRLFVMIVMMFLIRDSDKRRNVMPVRGYKGVDAI